MKKIALALILGVTSTALMQADYNQPKTSYYQTGTYDYTQNNSRQGYVADQKNNNATTNQDNKYPTEKKYPKDQFKSEADRATNNRIRNQITGWFTDQYNEIILRTSDGVVIIDGFVSSPDNQTKLSEEIEKVNGVKHVINNAKVKQKK